MSHKTSRLELLGSGATSGKTSFFVLAPTVPCLLAEIVDSAVSIREATQQSCGTQQQPKTLMTKNDTVAPPQADCDSPTTSWISVLVETGYETETETLASLSADQLQQSLFPALELIEELLLIPPSEETASASAVVSPHEFWSSRVGQEEEEAEGNDGEVDEHTAALFHEIGVELDPDNKKKGGQQQRSFTDPSTFEKHIEEWRNRHQIEVPDVGGADALQLRGGKSSVISWAQRELAQYRQQTAQSRVRIERIRKEADRILAEAESSSSSSSPPPPPPSSSSHNHGSAGYSSVGEIPPDGGSGGDATRAASGGGNSRVQMLRRIVASKSVLSLQAQSTAPASESEAALWTREAPPRPASAILSVIAGAGDDDEDMFGNNKHTQRSAVRRPSSSASCLRQQQQSGGRRRDSSSRPASSSGSLPPRPQIDGQRREGEINKAPAVGDPLERLMLDRMELLLGGVSPGVIVAEATQPRTQQSSAQIRAEVREERRRKAEVQRQKNLGVVGRAKEAALRKTISSTSSPRKHVSEIDPHKPATPMVLVQKTPGQRKRIVLEEMQRQQSVQREMLRSQRSTDANAKEAESSSVLFASIGGVSPIVAGNKQQGDVSASAAAAAAASSSVEIDAQQQRPHTASQKHLLLSRMHRQLHAPGQPTNLWDFGHHVETAGDVAHWNMVQQLAVKAMQQPRPEGTQQQQQQQSKGRGTRASPSPASRW